MDAARRGFIEALHVQNAGAVRGHLLEYWRRNQNYHPLHTGRCYQHGHEEVQTLEDTVACQVETLTRAVESLLPAISERERGF